MLHNDYEFLQHIYDNMKYHVNDELGMKDKKALLILLDFLETFNIRSKGNIENIKEVIEFTDLEDIVDVRARV